MEHEINFINDYSYILSRVQIDEICVLSESLDESCYTVDTNGTIHLNLRACPREFISQVYTIFKNRLHYLSHPIVRNN